MSEPNSGRGALVTGGLAAILASTCCLGPLVLVTLGFSGAWISNLTVLEPYRPVFIGAALLSLYFAYRRIFQPVKACKPGEVCAIPQVRSLYKLIFWIVAALAAVALAYPYLLPLFY
ncbi:mercuric ion transporter MerT [Polaromonas sp.]|jgi:mercuric ion transport protein|uniref:mercuric ion transporter MerT n=1 Tax=Polaromonas sp. TaxID=1869339 RepID=UPI001DA12044|nr:mercuric ion transporter MerT [Polaromonas sp.]MBT9474888.1 mercuric ion transporter MerT [Polaromonas sp.]